MKKKIGIAVLVTGIVYASAFFIKSNSKALLDYETTTLTIATIENKIVATGKVVPEDEVEIKPQIAGIIEKIMVQEGEKVNAGDLLAIIKVVPNEQSLNNAQGRVKNSEYILTNMQSEFDRNKTLYSKGIISEQEYNNIELKYNQSVQDLENAKSDLQIIKLGSAGGSSIANTNIRATVTGTVLEIPVKKGDQVIQANTFNAGTTIATIADLNIMIFEGKVDEAEVGKLGQDMPLVVTLAAIEDKEYAAKLKFIAPKGIEEAGAVQFKIEGEVYLDDEYFVRAGYSANASIITERRDSVLAISEALLQYDLKTKEAYIEVEIGEQEFERREIELGLSDGINAEILSGVTKDDKIKIWNETEPEKKTGVSIELH
ncbi:MAG: efflux RND transporter periplasmic adaptor subunit [Flavobacteriales bacterium]|jgi:HlyD family secretion protein|nr:efflux RND transporter periplasmic adaptor subunit [Flavobacteriales bacterium]MDC3394985.1 efflux RND transporter periplasmic adaptor subunit [Flavobacteriales bacterium]